MSKELTLHRPTHEELEDAFRRLPRHGRLCVSCAPAELVGVLRSLESIGFVGMLIDPSTVHDAFLELAAYKAKQGPCYDTGRVARYRGSAVAALDDDNHLVPRELRVCEKTASVYQLPAYQGVMEVSAADRSMLARLGDDPIPFDCNTYEQDLQLLLEGLPVTQRVMESFLEMSPPSTDQGRLTAVLYPGPFRMLILWDGSLLRRAQATLVLETTAQSLGRHDACVVVSSEQPAAARYTAVPAQRLQELYAELGSACLLGDLPLADTVEQRSESDLSALETISAQLHQRLITTIERQEQHFVLVGTSRDDPHGCCPSLEVTEALRLVDSGVLAAYRTPAPADACPVTVLAFAGEISVEGDRPHFHCRSELRTQVLERLRATPPAPTPETGPANEAQTGGGMRRLLHRLLGR